MVKMHGGYLLNQGQPVPVANRGAAHQPSVIQNNQTYSHFDQHQTVNQSSDQALIALYHELEEVSPQTWHVDGNPFHHPSHPYQQQLQQTSSIIIHPDYSRPQLQDAPAKNQQSLLSLEPVPNSWYPTDSHVYNEPSVPPSRPMIRVKDVQSLNKVNMQQITQEPQDKNALELNFSNARQNDQNKLQKHAIEVAKINQTQSVNITYPPAFKMVQSVSQNVGHMNRPVVTDTQNNPTASTGTNIIKPLAHNVNASLTSTSTNYAILLQDLLRHTPVQTSTQNDLPPSSMSMNNMNPLPVYDSPATSNYLKYLPALQAGSSKLPEASRNNNFPVPSNPKFPSTYCGINKQQQTYKPVPTETRKILPQENMNGLNSAEGIANILRNENVGNQRPYYNVNSELTKPNKIQEKLKLISELLSVTQNRAIAAVPALIKTYSKSKSLQERVVDIQKAGTSSAKPETMKQAEVKNPAVENKGSGGSKDEPGKDMNYKIMSQFLIQSITKKALNENVTVTRISKPKAAKQCIEGENSKVSEPRRQDDHTSASPLQSKSVGNYGQVQGEELKKLISAGASGIALGGTSISLGKPKQTYRRKPNKESVVRREPGDVFDLERRLGTAALGGGLKDASNSFGSVTKNISSPTTRPGPKCYKTSLLKQRQKETTATITTTTATTGTVAPSVPTVIEADSSIGDDVNIKQEVEDYDPQSELERKPAVGLGGPASLESTATAKPNKQMSSACGTPPSTVQISSTTAEDGNIEMQTRAFKSKESHMCVSCKEQVPSNMFWINVVTNELQCISCLTKWAFKTTAKNDYTKLCKKVKVLNDQLDSLQRQKQYVETCLDEEKKKLKRARRRKNCGAKPGNKIIENVIFNLITRTQTITNSLMTDSSSEDEDDRNNIKRKNKPNLRVLRDSSSPENISRTQRKRRCLSKHLDLQYEIDTEKAIQNSLREAASNNLLNS